MSRRPLSCWGTLVAVASAGPLLWPPFAHSDTCTGLSLNALAPAIVGATPNAVAVGDFDRDGRMDVAVAQSGSNGVSILLGDGLGGFTPGPGSPISTGGGSNPIDIAAGDLDRDGILDLVVGFGSSAQARVLRGTLVPPGSFDNSSAPFPLNAIPTRIYLADFDQDADLDLLVLAEMGQRLLLYRGAAGISFAGAALTNIDLSGLLEQPSGAAILDFDRDGDLDLAVAMRSRDWVRVYFGDGSGVFSFALSFVHSVGVGPRDVATGDVDRDGWLDLVTADSGASSASVLLNSGGAALSTQPSVAVGGVPIRVALVDLDHDGVLDLAALDDSATPRVPAFQGRRLGPPYFDATPYSASLPPGAGPRGLGVGRFTSDGRADLVTALSTLSQALVIENQSGTPCLRPSFAGAPRSYLTGNGPVSTAAADFDEDGRQDLVVATANDAGLRILRNVNDDFTSMTPILGLSPAPRGVAVADMNVDGDMDVVLAQGQLGSGKVQVYLGNGMGGLAPGASQPAGDNTSAVVIGDFNGDGAPDVAATSEGSGFVYVFLNDGAGGISAGLQAGVGAAPRALVAGFLNADAFLDLAVANFGSNNVSILGGNGNGTFLAGPFLPVGINPQGIAAADLNGDGRPDLAAADNGSSQVSVILQDGFGGFLAAVAYPVGTNPTAVALVHLEGDPKPEIAVTTATMVGAQILTLLTNNGLGVFTTQSDHPVRNSPQAITLFDADSDGLVDLAVPCRSADAVVILIQRPPGPPVLSAAPRVAVRDAPRAAASGDFDGDGDLDVAVANSGIDNRVSLLAGDGLGGLSEYATLPAIGAEAIAAADFNRDGKLDLAVSAPGAGPPTVEIYFGAGGGAFAPQPAVSVGGVPDDLVPGDFDRDGDVDLALCDKVATGLVKILRNGGLGTFTVVAGPGVGNQPTAIVSADFDRDGDLDLAVANDNSNDLMILTNSGGAFAVTQTLALAGGETSPVSLAAADFDGNGVIDLAAASIDFDRLYVYRNLGSGSFSTPPGVFDVPYIAQFVISADVNLDGKPDLVALAAGVSILRGRGGMDFDPPQTVVARYSPRAAVVGDLDRDGRPDVVVVNEESDDVTILRSTACQSQRLEVTLQPAGCSLGLPPYSRDVQLKAFDEGGNLATCAAGTVGASIVPGTGDPMATLGGPISQPLTAGVASFVGLTIDKPGRRYELQFMAGGIPPAHTRRFTLGPAPVILGPNSVCPASSGTYSMEGGPTAYDSFAWTLNPPGPPPFAYTPSVLLSNPPLMGARTLDVTARVDECVVTPPARSIFFGDLASVTLDTLGASSVCVDCIGGSAKAIEMGGGAPISRQWGYRTTSGVGIPISIPGETGEIYVLKGTSFPGPGTYFVVVTTTPTCGSPTVSSEWMVMVDNSLLSGEVRHLAASSRGNSLNGDNQLLWVNTTGSAEEVRIRWNQAPSGTNACFPPVSVTVPTTPPGGEFPIPFPPPNTTASFPHSGLLLNTAYCYSVFVKVSGMWSPGRTVKARPFDATTGPVNSVKWAYATGGTAVAPPTVSAEGILAMSNDRTVHALTRGSSGGQWPPSWVPTELTGVAHSRSPVVPFVPPLAGSDTVLFAADDASPGFVHAIDARTGLRPWPAQMQNLTMTGAPGGMFTQFGGIRDLLFVGTRDSALPNELRALNLADGSFLEAYAGAGSPGQIGPINGSPAIDYATRRVYFASHKRLGGDTFFCIEVTSPPTFPVFTWKWSRDLGNITGSPVLRGGRVYVGTDAGVVYSLDAAMGLMGDDRVYTPAPLDGPIKGFLFPDRRNDDLFFATDSKVWSVSDDVASMTLNWMWTPGVLNPSIVLHRPQTDYLYVGSANGELYELNFNGITFPASPPSKLQVLGGGLGQIGAPSLDIGVTPRLLIVGSEPGVLYGVEVPFP